AVPCGHARRPAACCQRVLDFPRHLPVKGMTGMHRILSAIATIACIAFAPDSAAAEAYPTKPVKLIVPFAPGGGSDFIARLVATKLGERLGQPVIVENRPGAGGTVGAELAIKSAPDGYTLLLCPASYTVNANLYKLTFDPVNDITPVAQL